MIKKSGSSVDKLKWEKLLLDRRRKPKLTTKTKEKSEFKSKETRTEIERDFDRILFSTPVRRLADKTQVFPLEKNDSVRTRLTHSHEVSNLSRSIGTALIYTSKIFEKIPNVERNIPSLLAAIGLVHDLGNPPFGHQGEAAIQAWFKKNHIEVFNVKSALTPAMKNDFLKFEGNAQTLRLLTRLQVINDEYGLDLTYASLAALMKYPTSSNKIDKNVISKKKHGFFQSENDIVRDIWKVTGLKEGIRHPLTYIMEACDDIAYSVLDAEDAVKKGLVSFSDLVSYLEHHENGDKAINAVRNIAFQEHKKFRNANLSPNELNDITMIKFRVYSIHQMVVDVIQAFIDYYDAIINGELKNDLISVSKSNRLVEVLKNFDKAFAYKNRAVLEVELTGFNTISGLMDLFWRAIKDREDESDPSSKRKDPFAAYAYSRISENYRRVFEDKNNKMPIRYKELQLLTDMISGMTDGFAVSLFKELKQYL